MLSLLVYVLHRRAQISKGETERKGKVDFANVKQYLTIYGCNTYKQANRISYGLYTYNIMYVFASGLYSIYFFEGLG